MVAAGSGVYFIQQFGAIVFGDAFQQYFYIGILAHKATID